MRKKKAPIIAKPITFRYFIGSSRYKIVLRSGEYVIINRRTETEEGFAATKVIFERFGNELIKSKESLTRDCDGTFRYRSKSKCKVQDRFARRGSPAWEKFDESYRDYRAEACGY